MAIKPKQETEITTVHVLVFQDGGGLQTRFHTSPNAKLKTKTVPTTYAQIFYDFT